VDIISMSWSINSSNKIPDLDAALVAADNAGIIMFCASIDEGTMAPDKTYPRRATNSCIKIGACTGDGDRLSWVSETNSNFLLPGDAPITTAGEKVQGSHYRHLLAGSSIATARAAGLSAALLYCDRLIGTPKVRVSVSPSRTDATQFVEPLKSEGKIAGTFKALSFNSGSNKFPRIWAHLPDAQELMWDMKADPIITEKTKIKLEDLMKSLRPLRS
jgi:hypothetical protein